MPGESSTRTRATNSVAFRLLGSAVLLTIFLFLIWNTARTGFGSLLSAYAVSANNVPAADAAVNLAPTDPDAHYLHAAILEANSDLPTAIAEYEKAVGLRPDDYVLWLALARARELNGEKDHALAAARQAVTLAPFYAQPHWQLGNLLVRAGQRDEGFKELRLAGASNPILLPGIIDLAWQLSKGDVQFVKQSIKPQTPESYKALAEYFKNRDKVAEAIAMFRAAGSGTEVVRARSQYISELISAKKFREAYQLWSIGRSLDSGNAISAMIDPGFEQESDLDEPGFGWRTATKTPSVKLSLDNANPKEGRSSLRVDFSGDSDSGQAIISQLVLIEAKTHYQLRLAFHTEGLISGGPPNVSVIDPQNNTVLGQLGELPPTTDGWREAQIDFTSGESTTAVQIALQRERCAKSPCPIFGRLWLDSFSLQKR
jgi:tetratricopeptide (TPR) repeat protein